MTANMTDKVTAKMTTIFVPFYLQKAAFATLIFGCIVLIGIGFFEVNLIETINNGSLDGIGFVLYFLVALATFYNITRRDFYLPFLGHSVHPCNVLTPKTPHSANLSITVHNLTPNVNVVYWASDVVDPIHPDKVVETPWDAYDKYANSGVALTNDNGTCVLKIRKPSQYKIPMGFKLKKHVHFRECIGKGMLGPVRTKYVSEK